MVSQGSQRAEQGRLSHRAPDTRRRSVPLQGTLLDSPRGLVVIRPSPLRLRGWGLFSSRRSRNYQQQQGGSNRGSNNNSSHGGGSSSTNSKICSVM
ncbi:unnamed protein product [Heterosigma akashiwo]